MYALCMFGIDSNDEGFFVGGEMRSIIAVSTSVDELMQVRDSFTVADIMEFFGAVDTEYIHDVFEEAPDLNEYGELSEVLTEEFLQTARINYDSLFRILEVQDPRLGR